MRTKRSYSYLIWTENMYYLTVFENDEEIIWRKEFNDYSKAILYLQQYYKPRNEESNAILEFTTVTINGEFASSYTELMRYVDVPKPEVFSKRQQDETPEERRYVQAVKNSNSFLYDKSYHFLIQSERGIRHHEQWLEDDE